VAAAPARPRRRNGSVIFGVLAGLLVLAGIGLFAGAGWYEQQYAGKFFPGVRVYSVDLGGKTRDEAQVLLENQTAGFTTQPLNLGWTDQQWTPTPGQLGMQVNLDRTLDNAYNVGRVGGMLDVWRDRWDVANEGRIVPLSVTLDEGKIQAYLQNEVAPKIDQEMKEGDVWLQGEQVKTSPSQEGRALNIYPAIQAIGNSIARMASNGRIDLPVTVTKPAVAQAEIDATAKQLQGLLSGPLVVRIGAKQFSLDARGISQKLLLLKRSADPAATKHYDVVFQEENLKAVVADWADQVDTAPQNARFAWNNGQLTVLKESQDGIKVNQEKAIAAVKAALATTEKRTVDLPTDTRQPKVSSKDIGALGIKELIGTGNTSFKGSSQERATNIKVAAQVLNGVVVPPGDTFSFLDAVAPITLDRGYVEGYVIAAERTQRGVGGGVCQVSTTVFRAAFWSALQVTERHQHAYRVSWYESKGEPVGFDAAVFDPGTDLQFVNTTPGFLLVQSDLTGDELNVNFYGT
jgi:vancomycin resistance protein YoaR